MTEEEKDKIQKTEVVETPLEEKRETEEAEPVATEEAQHVPNSNAIAEKRGRMIMAGLVAAVILSVVAVLVAGVFQLTSRWLVHCPTELPVNDPAPMLWTRMVSDEVIVQSLGVPQKLEDVSKFKGLAPAVTESGADTRPTEGKETK